MDKQIIDALNNLSLSLEEMSNALKSKDTNKSSISSALSSGNFSNQILLIQESISQIKTDTTKILDNQNTLLKLQEQKEKDSNNKYQKILDNQDTLLKLQEQKEKDSTEIDTKYQRILDSQDTLLKLQEQKEKDSTEINIKYQKILDNQDTIISLQKEKIESKDEKKGFFNGVTDNKKIASGVSAILLIASGILAIGMAFKVIGSVDWKSVLVLSISLPMIAIAFSTLSNIKITPTQSLSLIPTMVAISTAIVLSSFLLSGVRPVNYLQSVSAILIAGIFAVASYGFSKIIHGIKGISTSEILKASFVLPILFLGISTAIALSSNILRYTQPIGFFQALTAVMIAGVFTAVSYGLGKMVNGLKGLSVSDILKASVALPLILIAISTAIALSSNILRYTQPIGFFQALTAVMIAGVFTVIAYGAGKMLQSFKNISTSTALAASIIMPIILIALSSAITLSSHILQGIKIIGFTQALTAVAIAGVFVALSYSVAPLMRGIKGINPKDMIIGGLTIIGLVSAIVLSSFLIERMSAIPISKIISFGILSIGIAASSVIVGGALKLLSKFGLKEMISGGLSLIAISTSIMLSSIILSKGNYDKYPPSSWILNSTVSLLSFGVMAVALGVIIESGIGAVAIASGLIAVVGIAVAILAVDKILSTGSYKNYPNSSWILGTGLGLVGFGLSAVLLGTIAVTGIGAVAIASGLIAVVAISKSIQLVSSILSKGSYDKFPSAKWALGIGSSIVAFASAIVVLGAINSVGGIVETLSLGTVKNPIDAGVSAIIKVASSILVVDKIMSAGSYKSYPTISWVSGVGGVIYNMVKNLLLLYPLTSTLKSSISSVLDITKAIALMDLTFSTGKFNTYPSIEWGNSSVYILSKIGSSFIILSKDRKQISDGYLTTIQIVKSIAYIDSIFSHGNYQRYPDKVWIDSVSKSLLGFAHTMSSVDNNYNISSILIGAKKVDIISDLIEKVSKNISRGVYNKYPDNKWSSGVSTSIYDFMNINSGLLSGISLLSDNTTLVKMSDVIVDIDSKFQKGNFTKYPTIQWINGTVYALQKFKSILSMMTFDDLGDKFTALDKNPLSNIISNIQLLAVAFEKLAKSVKSFTTSIGDIDSGKLNNIRSLSSNVVLLSLMDSEQFDKMMDKMEERSGVFGELIKDFNTKKSTVSNTNTFRPGTLIKEKSEFEMLGNKMDKMTAVLVDISSVVGSRGSLKSYLSSIKNDVNIGDTSRVSRN